MDTHERTTVSWDHQRRHPGFVPGLGSVQPGLDQNQWPIGRGFERFHGFLGAETNQWYPDLVYDNHPVEQPTSPEEGYHFGVDITDKALQFIRDSKAVAPDKPFFLYYAPGAAHAPHHAHQEWIEKYKGKFDMGYEAYRELVFERQKKLGIVAEDATLSPINPYMDETGPRVRRGRSLTPCVAGTSYRQRSNSCFSGWQKYMPGSSATPMLRSAGCWITWRTAVSLTTRLSCSCPTTARPAREDPTAQSTRTRSSTGSPTRSRRT